MKKWLTLLLALALLLPHCAALADEPAYGPYDKHVSFTASQYSQITEGGDYTHDEVYYKLQDMFNFDWELYAVDGSAWHEKNTMWITGGTMPDILFFGWNAVEYQQYAEQELIKPLPDGWESKYPNLAAQVEATGIAEAIKVNGKTYGIPHTIIHLVGPKNFVYAMHTLYYYRLDWAKELGYDWGVSCTLDEFTSYLRDCKEKFGSVGMVQSTGTLLKPLLYQFSKGYNAIYKNEEGKYVLGFADKGTVEGIQFLRDMYNEGLISKEYYLSNYNEWYAGKAAVIEYWGGPLHPQDMANNWLAAASEPNAKTLDDVKNIIGTVTVTDNNGVYHAAGTQGNFCFGSLFSPDLDDETFDRILAMYDYFATLEGFELTQLGIRGVDWDKDEEGHYTLLCPEILDGTYAVIREKYPSMYYLYLRNVLSDSAAYINSLIDPYWRQMSDDMYEFRCSQDIVPFDADLAFYSSDAANHYSINWNTAVDRLVLDSSLDIETEVARLIEENRFMWEPFINELNEKFGAK